MSIVEQKCYVMLVIKITFCPIELTYFKIVDEIISYASLNDLTSK